MLLIGIALGVSFSIVLVISIVKDVKAMYGTKKG